MNHSPLERTRTRFHVDEKIYLELKESQATYVLHVAPSKGKHPKGTYEIPNDVAINFINMKRLGQGINWRRNQNFHQDGVPRDLRDYFKEDDESTTDQSNQPKSPNAPISIITDSENRLEFKSGKRNDPEMKIRFDEYFKLKKDYLDSGYIIQVKNQNFKYDHDSLFKAQKHRFSEGGTAHKSWTYGSYTQSKGYPNWASDHIYPIGDEAPTLPASPPSEPLSQRRAKVGDKINLGDPKGWDSSKRNVYIIDTNVFIDCPKIITAIDRDIPIIISVTVLDELDRLRQPQSSLDPEERAKTKKAIDWFSREDWREWKITGEEGKEEWIPEELRFRKNPDDRIIAVAREHKSQGENPIILSSDKGLVAKARGHTIITISLTDFLKDQRKLGLRRDPCK